MCSIAARVGANALLNKREDVSTANADGPPSGSGARAIDRDWTRSVFELRLENFAGKHKSSRLADGFDAPQIDRPPFLFFGKARGFIRAQALHLDAHPAFQLEQFGPLFLHEKCSIHS